MSGVKLQEGAFHGNTAWHLSVKPSSFTNHVVFSASTKRALGTHVRDAALEIVSHMPRLRPPRSKTWEVSRKTPEPPHSAEV
jgi:hypothetical protein